jgi:hypothetical protein
VHVSGWGAPETLRFRCPFGEEKSLKSEELSVLSTLVVKISTLGCRTRACREAYRLNIVGMRPLKYSPCQASNPYRLTASVGCVAGRYPLPIRQWVLLALMQTISGSEASFFATSHLVLRRNIEGHGICLCAMASRSKRAWTTQQCDVDDSWKRLEKEKF